MSDNVTSIRKHSTGGPVPALIAATIFAPAVGLFLGFGWHVFRWAAGW